MVDNADNDNTESLHILLDSSLKSDDVMATFAQHGFTVHLFDSLHDLAAGNTHDALITSMKMTTGSITDDIIVDVPVKVSVLDDNQAVPQNILEYVDTVVPNVAIIMALQTKKLIEQHRQAEATQRELSMLENDVIIRKRKMLEIELLKNAIVRNVSHELRTPLLQVKSAVALIGEDQTDQKLINYAQNAVARLEIHVKNITMLGHSLDTSLSPIILRDAIEYAKRNLTRIWTRRTDSERININIEPNLPAIMADKQGLSTVLQLLIDNALKFGDDQDVEVIGRQSGDDKIHVAIRDNGIGIPEDKQSAIFDSFYQVDDTSTRPYGGAGVGLALVKLILENHGAIIHVDSKPGAGSTFWFELDVVNFDDIS